MSDRVSSCFTCESRDRSEWCSLDGEDLELLNRHKITNGYRPGQIIFYQGNPCLGVYCIAAGTVALRKSDANGNSVLVRILTRGETLGYRTYFSGGRYAATAEALSEARVCFVDRGAVSQILDRNPAVGYAFLRRLGEDLREADDAKLNSASMTVRARVAYFLLSLKERFGRVLDDGTLEIELPVSRQDMAAMVGTRPETIARTLRALEADQVARFEGRRVLIADLDALLDEVEAA